MGLINQHSPYQGGSPPGGGNREGTNRRVLTSCIDPKSLYKLLRSYSGKGVRSNTLEGILVFLHWVSNQKQPFEASANMGRQYLSRFVGKDLMPLLCELDILKKVSCHRDWEKKASTYITRPDLQFREYPMKLSNTSLRKLLSVEERKRERIEKLNPELEWVRMSLDQIELPENIAKRLPNNKYAAPLKALANRDFWVKWTRGRITTPITNLPDFAREALLFSGKPVSRLDLSSSHILLFCRYLRDLASFAVKHRDARIREANQIMTFIESGDFYKELLPSWDRDKSKKGVQTFLNSGGNGRYDRRIERAWRKRWPISCKVILGHSRPIGPELMRRENQLIKSTLMSFKEMGIFVIPVVDEVIVTLESRIDAINAFSEETYKLTGIIPKISGVRMGGGRV